VSPVYHPIKIVAKIKEHQGISLLEHSLSLKGQCNETFDPRFFPSNNPP
jgi:hypothetical protein